MATWDNVSGATGYFLYVAQGCNGFGAPIDVGNVTNFSLTQSVAGTGSVAVALSAYDAQSLQELWNFNLGTGINAPAVTYSVNGKQYIAVLAGSRQALNVWQNAPELKNNATASMLYVFEQ